MSVRNLMPGEDAELLNEFVDDILLQLPLIVRKIVLATRKKKSPTASDLQIHILIGLMTGPLKPSDISRMYLISRPNVTTLVNKLIERGMATRYRGGSDRRMTYVAITPKGRKLVQKRRKVIKDYLIKLFQEFDGDEIREIYASLEKYRNLLIRLNKIV